MEQKRKEMSTKEEFNELVAQYRKASDAEKRVIFAKMVGNLTNRNNGSNEYVLAKEISISSANFQELQEINGDINMKESQQKRESTSAEARDKMMKKNDYRP